MKRAPAMIVMGTICCIALGIFSNTSNVNAAEPLSTEEKIQLWGTLDKKYDESSAIAAYSANDLKIEADDFTVTNAEYLHQVETAKLAGYTGESAEQRALDVLLERYAVYYHALSMGYSISEAELDDYVAACRADMAGASNIEDFYAYLDARDITEDEYWEYFKENRRYYCVISQYKEPYYKDFCDNHPQFDPTDPDDAELWSAYWDDIKADAISSQHVMIH